METSVDTQNYSWKLENRPGYKILVLKHQSVRMGMFDKNWIKTLPSFARDRVPHVPKNVIDMLSPNMNVTITFTITIDKFRMNVIPKNLPTYQISD